SRPRPLARPAAVLAAAAVVAAGVWAVPGGGGRLDLAAAAYAQTSDAGDVLFSRIAVRTVVDLPGRRDVTVSTIKQWRRGEQSLTRVTFGHEGERPQVVDAVFATTGMPRDRSSSDPLPPIDPDEGAEERELLARARHGFVEDFRRSYERGLLQDDGDATFAGRPARRYVVAAPGPEGVRQEIYLDAGTGAPLGSVDRSPVYRDAGGADDAEDGGPPARRAGEEPVGSVVSVTTVETVERLAPTPENLARLER
ncbi:MAG: hypothetical protein AVDCRST_MAG13-3315, partial [uncultured Solirubrobacteraceae bacterium]